ncbi:MAG TPA: sigma-70 family RNA polymerase sigma factor [Thermoanaerobaculia bacterium]|jgi:RNA polymerase sigma factor for flagellar operon FliA
MNDRDLFEEQLETIERAIRRVSIAGRLTGADAEDFASNVKVALLDGEILRRWEGRSSLLGYVTIVVRRMLVDQKRAEGRWVVSAEAKRRGEAAVLLDRLLHHERRPFDEAAAIVMERHPGTTVAQLRETAAALPERAPKPRLVEMGEDAEERFAGSTSADERVMDRDRDARAMSASRAVSDAMASMTVEDRVILRMRFTNGASIAVIARALGIEQRPLYRRVETLLARLKHALAAAGLDASSVVDLIGGTQRPLEFGLRRSSGAYPAIGAVPPQEDRP